MAELQARSLDSAEETRAFENGKAEIVTLAGSTVGRLTFQGHLHLMTDDGHEQDIGAVDANNIPPGHDGWVIGDEAFVSVEFRSAADAANA